MYRIWIERSTHDTEIVILLNRLDVKSKLYIPWLQYTVYGILLQLPGNWIYVGGFTSVRKCI